MTALDKVFIKAYGKSASPAAPEAPPSPVPQGRRVDPAHPTPAPLAAKALATPATEEPPAEAHSSLFQPLDQGRIDARHDLPRPHWSLSGITAVASAPAKPVDASPTVVSVIEAVPAQTVAEQPPPSPLVQPQPEPATAHPPVRAAFEVDRFLWPEICQRLQSAGSWSQATRELASASRDGQQVFVIASQRRGEGRSTLALCLAQRLAEKKLRVTLVDADFHRPQLARQLKLLPAATWDDVLRGTLPLTESWIESVEDGVTLLPLKERADTTGLIGNPRLKELFSLLRRMNDIVLIDAGSLEDFGDREVLALLGGTAQVDGALIVRDVRKTTAAELDQAPRCLDALGIARVDVVENFVKT